MKKTILIVLLLIANTVVAQQNTATPQEEIQQLKAQLKVLRIEVDALYKELNKDYRTYRGVKKNVQATIGKQKHIIDSLNLLVNANNQKIATQSQELGNIKQTHKKATTKLTALNHSVTNNRWYWVIGTLLTLLLGALVYWLLGKRINSSKTNIENQLKNTKKSLEEEGVKLDSKLIEVLETQLKLQEANNQQQPNKSDKKEDHSLALKVADEIVRMQKNISRMDEKTKGLKPLLKGIERIQANFAANGYEMVNLLNKEYEDRMNLDVINFIDDDDIQEGKKIITKIIKPQVNYNGVLIQRAQIEVSQN